MNLKFTRFGRVAATALLGGVITAGTAQATTMVDAEIVLLMDVSGSVALSEFNLQKDGYEAAFRSTAVKNAITASTNGVAITLVQWDHSQYTGIGWTHLTDATTSDAFADAIDAMTRLATGGSTGLGEALVYGNILFATNMIGGMDVTSSRQVIDISGDGADNTGSVSSSSGRDTALAGDTDVINGIVILGESGLLSHYQDNVIGGANADGGAAFVLTASGFSSFETAITNKLVAEVTGMTPPSGIPEPGMIALFGIGLAGLGFTARRRKPLA